MRSEYQTSTAFKWLRRGRLSNGSDFRRSSKIWIIILKLSEKGQKSGLFVRFSDYQSSHVTCHSKGGHEKFQFWVFGNHQTRQNSRLWYVAVS